MKVEIKLGQLVWYRDGENSSVYCVAKITKTKNGIRYRIQQETKDRLTQIGGVRVDEITPLNKKFGLK